VPWCAGVPAYDDEGHPRGSERPDGGGRAPRRVRGATHLGRACIGAGTDPDDSVGIGVAEPLGRADAHAHLAAPGGTADAAPGNVPSGRGRRHRRGQLLHDRPVRLYGDESRHHSVAGDEPSGLRLLREHPEGHSRAAVGGPIHHCRSDQSKPDLGPGAEPGGVQRHHRHDHRSGRGLHEGWRVPRPDNGRLWHGDGDRDSARN